MALRIYNTLTRQKEDFVPLEPEHVKMYVCGPTVYDYSHIGHARVYVVFDVIRRWLEKSYSVKYVQNFTDVEDKIIARANEKGEDPMEFAARYADEFTKDCDDLGIKRPDVSPRVSTTMSEIITFCEDLEEKGFAYRVPSEYGGEDLFYRVHKFKTYTELSRREFDEVEVRSRVEGDARKESSVDFALWKAAKPNEPSWDSPFGKGRPGWHIECSAMSEKHLGKTFDIHGGGKDLIFPHHSNEIAQSEARHGCTFSRYWMHNGFVDFSGEKMSKSLGNFFTIREVTERYHPEALRYFLLTAQYRSSIDFAVHAHCPSCDAVMDKSQQQSLKCTSCGAATEEEVLRRSVRFPGLEEAEGRLAYLYETRRKVSEYLKDNMPKEGEDLSGTFSTKEERFEPWVKAAEHLDDDFNTPAMVAAMNELTRVANMLVDAREKELLGRKLKVHDRARLLIEWQQRIALFFEILNVGAKEPAVFLTEQRAKRCAVLGIDKDQVEALMKERSDARASKDFEASDKVRDALKEMGVEVRDGKSGASWTVV